MQSGYRFPTQLSKPLRVFGVIGLWDGMFFVGALLAAFMTTFYVMVIYGLLRGIWSIIIKLFAKTAIRILKRLIMLSGITIFTDHTVTNPIERKWRC